MKRILIGPLALMALASAPAWAADPAAPAAPVVSVTASATTSVANDRMYAWLRAEADNAGSGARGRRSQRQDRQGDRACQGGARRRGQDLRVFLVPVHRQDRTRPAGGSQQSISLEGGDFAALAALLTKLQADDCARHVRHELRREQRCAPQGRGRAHAGSDQGLAGACAERVEGAGLRCVARRPRDVMTGEPRCARSP